MAFFFEQFAKKILEGDKSERKAGNRCHDCLDKKTERTNCDKYSLTNWFPAHIKKQQKVVRVVEISFLGQSFSEETLPTLEKLGKLLNKDRSVFIITKHPE